MTKLCAAVLALMAAAVWPWLAQGHTPYRPEVVFVKNPNWPVPQFAAGHLGIVQQSDWTHLVISYRYLSGRPLTLAERKSFLGQSEIRELLRPFHFDDWKTLLASLPSQKWVKARAKFRSDKPPEPVGRADWWEYTDGETCLAGSFETAIRTLRDRARRYGAKSAQVQEWIAAQDQVFQNCPDASYRSKVPVIPAMLGNTSDVLVRADREYQIAAAHFYAGDLDKAIRAFEAIGRDASSPWQPLGPYLSARAVLRKGLEPDNLLEAEQRLQRVTSESPSEALRKSAAGLVNFIELRLHPDEQMRAIANQVAEATSGEHFGQEVVDYGYLLDKKIGVAPDFPGVSTTTREWNTLTSKWYEKRYLDLSGERSKNDLTDWVLTMWQGESASAREHAIARWRASGSLAWLVASISKIHGNDSAANELLAAAKRVPTISPAYLTVVYHRGRLLREQGSLGEARAVLDSVLRVSQEWAVSSVNLLKDQRMFAAASLDDFVGLVWRQPIGFTNGAIANGDQEYCNGWGWSAKCDEGIFYPPHSRQFLPQLGFDSASILNERLPLALLLRVAQSANLPENLRSRLGPALWARAVVLDRPDLAGAIAEAASNARPELKPYIRAYAEAKDPAERRFLAAYTIAHFPGLRPMVEDSSPRVIQFDFADNYRDNWWCKDGKLEEFTWPSGYEPPALMFLTGAERAAADEERKRIDATGAGGTWLSNILIDWAKTHLADERSPEALYFAMRTMRFGCDTDTKHSREAYVLLHRKFPSSPWTKKTKYWY